MEKKNSKYYMLAGLAAAVIMMSAMPGDSVLTTQGDTTIINTTTLTTDVEGYMGPTPIRIHVKANKIEKIEALPNEETPKYFAKVKKEMFPKWQGMTVSKALKANVDGVTGATMSSDAVKTNVKRGLEYYNKNKKK